MKFVPLILDAPVKDYIWGGTRLKDELGYGVDLDKVAEAWVLSARKNDDCKVLYGEYCGRTLSEMIELWGKECLGKRCDSFENFPLLVKLIDAKDKLSVQVHPCDDYALQVEGEYGKTEMWYVIDCEEGATLVYGFNREVSKEEFKERIENNTLDEVLNYVPVKKGDAFFIEAGTIHAIGAGIFIAEVQQNSNTTYRVSDYGRLGADGKPRELHIDKALNVTNTVPVISTKEYSEYKVGGATVKKLASCDKFTASVFSIEGKVFVGNKDTFVHLLVLQGHIIAVCEDGTEYSMYAGESLFVPAGAKIQVLGIGGKVLISHL